MPPPRATPFHVQIKRYQLGGRQLETFSPSRFYMYDRGTLDRQERDIMKAIADGLYPLTWYQEQLDSKIVSAVRAGRWPDLIEAAENYPFPLGPLTFDVSDAIRKDETASVDADVG